MAIVIFINDGKSLYFKLWLINGEKHLWNTLSIDVSWDLGFCWDSSKSM